MKLEIFEQASMLLRQLDDLDFQLANKCVLSGPKELPTDVFALLEAEARKALTEKRAALQRQFDEL